MQATWVAAPLPSRSAERRRLLFVAHRVPYPPNNGARVRAFHEIRALSKRFRVTLGAVAHDEADLESGSQLRGLCERVLIARAGGRRGLLRGGVSLLRGRSVTEGYFHSPRLQTLICAEAAREPFDLVLAYCSSMLPYALAVPAAARVIDVMDVDSVKWDSYAAATGWPKRWFYRREALMVRRLEQRAIEACEAVVLVSQAETRALFSTSGNVLAIGNGVDLDYFTPMEGPCDRTPSLVFTGQMDYRPNVEGVCWFIREVWPALRQRVPELTFTIVGRRPTTAVRRLDETPGVQVTGEVADVRPYLEASSAAVCPLQIARGVQNKVLEAMAMARPVVGSPAAIEGLDVIVGQDVLQADTARQFTVTILRLLQDAGLQRRLGASARRCIERRYTWSARMDPLVTLCEQLVGRSRPRSPA